MISTKFNPLTYANELKDAGLDQKVAEVIAMSQSKVIDEIITDHLATKEDLKKLEISEKEDFKKLESKILELKVDLIKWMAGMMFALGTFTITFIKFVH